MVLAATQLPSALTTLLSEVADLTLTDASMPDDPTQDPAWAALIEACYAELDAADAADAIAAAMFAEAQS